ncbi:MAG: hypothetical protein M5U08_17575 [Burkholderiales bacterium]|nr:hypothetical protein [Burkholderiales bacterium]
MQGKKNLAAGFLFLAGFMLYGFVLIYLRDLAPGKEAWIADYADGKHLEARMAHAHGGLFALINVVVGYALVRLPIGASSARCISWLALAGMLLPVGILATAALGLPPLLVPVGGLCMIAAMVWLGLASASLREPGEPASADARPPVDANERKAT